MKKCSHQLMDMVDEERGFTLMHLAVLSGVEGKVLTLIDLAKKHQKATEEQIKVWVNSRSSGDQFTPLHLASFKGNMDAVKTLVTHGSDPMALNGFGLNMMHTASQGDSAAPLYYFKKLGVDINM